MNTAPHQLVANDNTYQMSPMIIRGLVWQGFMEHHTTWTNPMGTARLFATTTSSLMKFRRKCFSPNLHQLSGVKGSQRLSNLGVLQLAHDTQGSSLTSCRFSILSSSHQGLIGHGVIGLLNILEGSHVFILQDVVPSIAPLERREPFGILSGVESCTGQKKCDPWRQSRRVSLDC